MFPLLSMGNNRAWRRVKERHETDQGYLLHTADEVCKQNVSQARSKAICALAMQGILLIDESSWPRVHPVIKPYLNREGTEVAVNRDSNYESVENEVLGCHVVLKRLADDNALVKGGHLRNVNVRFPTDCVHWKPLGTGWHVERGAGYGLNCTCVLHLTNASIGGGCVAVVVGSHKFVQRVFSWRLIPERIKQSFIFHMLIGYIVSWAAQCGVWEIREVVASEGDVVQMHPFLVHSTSRNVCKHEATLSCQIKVFSKVPSKNNM